MMHYRKAENVEQEITKESLPFEDCLPKANRNFLWMHVKGGTKVNNVISYAKTALDKNEYRAVVWSGSGGGVVKTISCAEILKRQYPLYQVTRMCYTVVEEHWKPQMEGLEEIVANRQIPCLHILLSLDPIDDSINGLQKPHTKTDFWVDQNAKPPSQRRDGPRSQQQRAGKQQQHQQRQAKQPRQQQQEGKQLDEQQEQQQERRQQSNQKKPRNRNQSAQHGQQGQQQQRRPQQPAQHQFDNSKEVAASAENM